MAIPWLVERDLISVMSLLSFFLLLIPVTWHVRSLLYCSIRFNETEMLTFLVAWNIGYLLASFWLGWMCLITFINSMIWRGNITNWAPVFCDITTRLTYAASIGTVTSGLVVARRVAEIATGRIIFHSRRRIILTDLVLGLSLPLIQLMFFWFAQGHRFTIVEDVGCVAAVPCSILRLVLTDIWPLIIGVVSWWYSGKTLLALHRRRKETLDLQQMCEGLTFDHYYRLVFMAALEMAATVPISIWNLIHNYRPQAYYPWKGFADLHWGFSRIDRDPTVIWLSNPLNRQAIEQGQWIGIGCALGYYLVFGTTKEARYRYKSAALKLLGLIGVRRESTISGIVADPTKSTLVFAQRSLAVSQSREIAQPCLQIGDQADAFQINSFASPSKPRFSEDGQDGVVEITRPKSVMEIV